VCKSGLSFILGFNGNFMALLVLVFEHDDTESLAILWLPCDIYRFLQCIWPSHSRPVH